MLLTDGGTHGDWMHHLFVFLLFILAVVKIEFILRERSMFFLLNRLLIKVVETNGSDIMCKSVFDFITTQSSKFSFTIQRYDYIFPLSHNLIHLSLSHVIACVTVRHAQWVFRSYMTVIFSIICVNLIFIDLKNIFLWLD